MLLLLIGCGCARVARAQNYADGSFQRTLNVSGPVELDVSTGSGRIEIHAGTSGRVEVHGRIRAYDRLFGTRDVGRLIRDIESDPPIEQSGNVIALWVEHQTDRHVAMFGSIFEIPATWFQAINPLLIILGTPLLTSIFDADRWDYIYYLQRGKGDEKQLRRLVVLFKNDRLASYESDAMPEEKMADNLILGRNPKAIPKAPPAKAPQSQPRNR